MKTLILVGIYLAVTLAVVKITDIVFKKIEKHSKAVHIRFIHSILEVVIIAIAIYSLLSAFEVTSKIGSLMLKSGSIALALITFVAQKSLGNVIGGFSISISKPYEIGQKIRVISPDEGIVIAEGIVESMTMRHTVILQYDGQTSIVPNSIMDDAVIINTNYTDGVGNHLEFEISYDSDINLAKDIIKETCESQKSTLKISNILINRLSSNGIVLKLTLTSKDLNSSFLACSDIRQQVIEKFKQNNISIPYNTITINDKKEGI